MQFDVRTLNGCLCVCVVDGQAAAKRVSEQITKAANNIRKVITIFNGLSFFSDQTELPKSLDFADVCNEDTTVFSCLEDSIPKVV
jgi:hypothetical protein